VKVIRNIPKYHAVAMIELRVLKVGGSLPSLRVDKR
jgi:hypothetical protein